MKKILILVLSLFLLIGCSNNNEENKVENNEPINVEEVGISLLNSRADDVYSLFSSEIKDYVSVDEINNIFANYGPEFEDYTINTFNQEELEVNEISYNYEDVTLTITLSVENNEIVGLFYNFKYRDFEDELIKEDTFFINDTDAALTIPKNIDSYPLVIIVGGSGPTDKNGTIGPNSMYRDIAFALAYNGIATIRYDKASYEQMIEENENILEFEYLNDFENVINYSGNELENVSEIYVMGHSLGGMLTPYFVSEYQEHIDGGIILNGSARYLEDIIYDQTLKAISDLGVSDEEYELLVNEAKLNYEIMKNSNANSTNLIGNIEVSYYHDLRELTGTNYLNNVDYPLLIIGADKDFQVSVEEDYKSYQDILINNSDVEFKLYEGLNHQLMPSKTMTIEEYAIASKVDENVINDIVDFIKN